MKTLVLGLGNPLLTDDAVGLHVACALRKRLANRPDVDVDVDYQGGLRVMERMIGYDRGIVIDALRAGGCPGTVRNLSEDSIPTQHSSSAHDANLSTALALGRMADAHLPKAENVLLFGIEAEDVTTFGDRCTPEVEAAVPRAVEAVLRALDEGGIHDGIS
jgi:hydrogenase maturation protease